MELANAMLLSAFEDRAIELLLDGVAYEKALQGKIAASTQFKKEWSPCEQSLSQSRLLQRAQLLDSLCREVKEGDEFLG